MSKLLLAILVVCLVGCSNEYTAGEYTKNVCLGDIQDFNEQVLQKGISYRLAYLIENKSAKVKFADHDIKAMIITRESLLGHVIASDGGNYFAFAPDDGGKVEYEFNPDKWFVGTCK